MNIDVVRAWKDRRYRESLSAQEQMSLPANPVGEIELHELDLASVVGGLRPETIHSACNIYLTCACTV